MDGLRLSPPTPALPSVNVGAKPLSGIEARSAAMRLVRETEEGESGAGPLEVGKGGGEGGASTEWAPTA